MKKKIEWSWCELGIAILGSTAFVVGLFFFCAALCMIFGGYRF